MDLEALVLRSQMLLGDPELKQEERIGNTWLSSWSFRCQKKSVQVKNWCLKKWISEKQVTALFYEVPSWSTFLICICTCFPFASCFRLQKTSAEDKLVSA